MSKYRKIPVVIEAIQWDGSDERYYELQRFSRDRVVAKAIISDNIVIRTLEGDMVAYKGDWIIKGVKGEVYPCRPDIFEMTYEAVDE